jgi:hypothetical protein
MAWILRARLVASLNTVVIDLPTLVHCSSRSVSLSVNDYDIAVLGLCGNNAMSRGRGERGDRMRECLADRARKNTMSRGGGGRGIRVRVCVADCARTFAGARAMADGVVV